MTLVLELKMPTFHLPYNHYLIELARQMRKNPTSAERKLWDEYLHNLSVRVLLNESICLQIGGVNMESFKR
jgi:very-short-patch-repair endonuclease